LRLAAAALLPCESCYVFLTAAGTPERVVTGARLGLDLDSGWLCVFGPAEGAPPQGAFFGMCRLLWWASKSREGLTERAR
jgi:hypothetical protein